MVFVSEFRGRGLGLGRRKEGLGSACFTFVTEIMR
jgi:hypothetical protein